MRRQKLCCGSAAVESLHRVLDVGSFLVSLQYTTKYVVAAT